LAAQIDLLEPTGLGTVLHLRLAEQRIKVFTTERLTAGIRDAVNIAVQSRDLLLFDPDSGERLR
jgi:multiple sugar transport system ATP-binding protein